MTLLSERKKAVIATISERYEEIPPSMRNASYKGLNIELLTQKQLVKLLTIFLFELKVKSLQKGKTDEDKGEIQEGTGL